MRYLLTAATIAVAGVVASAASAEKWDMPMAYAATNYHTQNGMAFAEAVGAATGGELEIVVHPSGSLFKGNEIKRAVQTGQAPIGERLLSAHQNENAVFAFDSVPFLATSFEDSELLLEAARPVLEEILAEQNLVLIYTAPWPPQGIYSKDPLNKVSDMEGLKFRAYNTATARLAELAGAVPVQIEAAELSQALATGVASSFISSGSTGWDRKVWEHLNYHYEVNAWLPRNSVFVNKSAWDGLDEATQNAIMAIGQYAAKNGDATARYLTGWYLGELAANGMTVTKASPELKSGFQKIGETMTAEWLQQAGEQGRTIIDRYKELKAKTTPEEPPLP